MTTFPSAADGVTAIAVGAHDADWDDAEMTEPMIPGARAVRVALLGAIGVALVAQILALTTHLAALPAWFALVLATVAAGLSAQRFRVPIALAATVLAAAAPLLTASVGVDPTAMWTAGVFVTYLVTRDGLPAFVAGPVIAAAGFLSTAWFQGSVSLQRPGPTIAVAAALLAAAIGAALRAQARTRFALEGRTREALAGRAAAVERSVAQERLRIARDLHDGVGHQIAVVSMHLGAAEVRLPKDAVEVRESLVAARRAVQEVLGETEAILRVLRLEDDADALAPHAEHGAVHRLVDAARSAGQLVDTDVSGLERQLPAEVSAAVFRVVQEALTNSAKHGEGPVSLRVAISDGSTVVEVVNFVSANARAGGRGGRGLVGMRERVAHVGGRVEARTEGAVFRVTATIPAQPGQEGHR